MSPPDRRQLDAAALLDSLQPSEHPTDRFIPGATVVPEDGGEAEDPHGQRETQQEHHAERKRRQDAGEQASGRRHDSDDRSPHR